MSTKPEGRFDPGVRRRAQRAGRERGCWVYIAASELRQAGYDPDGQPPWYRTWGQARGSVFVRLYRTA